MQKTLYIIAGLGSTAKGLEGVPLAVAAKKKGYHIRPIHITWARRVPTQWIQEAAQQITEQNASILGFSFGAFVAVALAQQILFKKMFIASLSPYYADDVKRIPKSWKKIVGKRRVIDAAHYHFPSDIKTPAIFFAGMGEGPFVMRRVKRAYAKWAGLKKLELIPGVGHNIGNPDYTARVLKYL